MDYVDDQVRPRPQRQMLIFNLACCCQAAEQASCIIGYIREMPMRKRYDWVLSQSNEELGAIYQTYHECLNRQLFRRSLRRINACAV